MSAISTRMLPVLLAVCGLILIAPGIVSGQAVFPTGNGKALAGVVAVDASLWFPVALHVEPSVRDRWTETGQATFELALRRDGVRVESTAPNYLLMPTA
jgi:hypothetical protein